ncbi:MAG: DUF362 domain-containing protein [Deltaproteobacteria bacterium]|nr:DUF362 domain-containing protein [Deltaproteobacteria bacterium]
MEKPVVGVGKYERPGESVAGVVDLAGGLSRVSAQTRVFIKPNIVFWTKATAFPKWGVITTSRVVQDMVKLLADHGVTDITIGEGVVADPKDKETPAHAFSSLGYAKLAERYGVKVKNAMEGPFAKADIGGGRTLRFFKDVLEADLVVDLPVMKTHNQTTVSLGIKNLKGTIDIPSRKKCHSADPEKDLHWWVSRLADPMKSILTVIDGIYTLERGPAFDGRIHRSNLLVASWDILAADMVGAALLGYEPEQVPHLTHCAKTHGRSLDIASLDVRGEDIAAAATPHEFDFPYKSDETGEMPVPLAKQGIRGLFYRKFDTSMCTYCSALNGLILTAIRAAYKGTPFDQVEVLTGKMMEPAPGMKHTILVGKCMWEKNKNHPAIADALPIKGCPPAPDKIVEALKAAGIDADENLFAHVDQLPGFFMARYAGKPEYDESFFAVE